jgi:hypothetical protein
VTKRHLGSWVTYGLVPAPIRRVPVSATDRTTPTLEYWLDREHRLYPTGNNPETNNGEDAERSSKADKALGRERFVLHTPVLRTHKKEQEIEAEIRRAGEAYAEYYANGFGL